MAMASWHILSPRASATSWIPMSLALKETPSPWNRKGSSAIPASSSPGPCHKGPRTREEGAQSLAPKERLIHLR